MKIFAQVAPAPQAHKHASASGPPSRTVASAGLPVAFERGGKMMARNGGRILNAPVARAQCKLKVGSPEDPLEREADRVADQVLQTPAAGSSGLTISRVESIGSVQRACAACAGELEDETIRRKPIDSIAEIQGKLAGAPSAVSQTSGGQPLTESVRREFGLRIGCDFSRVRIHADAAAADSARALHARAYTIGHNVVFGAGEYSPHTASGRRLLAHELAHVVQQGGASPIGGGDRAARPAAAISRSGPAIMRIPDETGTKATPPRYSYSTNCSWIDWGHTYPGLAKELIKRVSDASQKLTSSASATPEEVTGPRMETRAAGLLLGGVTPIAHIRRALNADEILSVALRIFMLQSLGFEQNQQSTELVGKSSFSEEDLPSNLISFYRAARGFDRGQIESLCDVWSVANSVAKIQNYNFQKNTSFRPLSLPPGGSWPAKLADITPAEAGGPLVNIPQGRFEGSLEPTENKSLGSFLGYEAINSGKLHLEQTVGSDPVDLSQAGDDPTTAPRYEVKPVPIEHNLEFRWIVRDPQDRTYLMRGLSGGTFQFGSQTSAFIGAATRALLKSRGVTQAKVQCRVAAGRGQIGQSQVLLEFPVTFQ